MKIWKEHNDGEKYYMGNKETIEIDCTDKGTAKSIQESINGVYECMDWKCNWCGELHTDDRDYTDYKDRVDEYLGDAITEIRTAVKDGKTKKETLEIIDEHFGSYTSGEECSDALYDIDRKVVGDFDSKLLSDYLEFSYSEQGMQEDGYVNFDCEIDGDFWKLVDKKREEKNAI